MPIQIGDLLLVPDHELEHFRTFEELRRFLVEQLGEDLTGIERFMRDLHGGNVTVVRLRSAPSRASRQSTPIPSIPLRELVGAWVPQPERPVPPVAEKAEPEPWFEATLLTDDGVPVPDVTLRVRDGFGFDETVTTDAEGHFRVATNEEAMHAIRVEQVPIKLPAPPIEPKKTEGYALRRDVQEELELRSNKAHTLVVTRPRATVCSLDGWWENQKVMVFQSARETDNGFVTVRGILRQALCCPSGGEVHVIGHADTDGAASDNDALALERAKSVYLYLSGQRQAWSEHAFANADVATLQAALYWIGLNSVVECDPGPVNGDWGPATSFGLTMLRLEAGIATANPLDVADWMAIYDQFDEGLASLMLTNVTGLNAARERLRIVDPTSKGERFPVDAPEIDGHKSAANRRVDIVFCAPGAVPTPESDEVYDSTFFLDHLVVAPECKVQILVTNPKMEPLPFSAVLLEVGPLGPRWINAGPASLIEFTALRSDRMRMLRGTEFGGGGTMMTNGLQEAVLVAQKALGELL
jgi:hypothetical protein